MKSYELINQDGCLFDKTEATSFAKAKEYFASKYEGSFTIVCEEERRNVKL